MAEIDPRDIIDRKAEQELFRDLVTFTTKARMLTIWDKGGRGKSTLLKRLQYNCRYEIKPPIPACLIELNNLRNPSPFKFSGQVVEELGVQDDFATFTNLDKARIRKDPAPFFGEGEAGSIRATAEVKGPMEAGSIASGLYSERTYITNPAFTPEQEGRARQKCVEGFFKDLKEICGNQPIVLILDGWERCNIDFRKWIVKELFEKNCFNRKENLRSDKLAVTVAGRPYGPEEPYGLRDNEFCPLFRSEEDHAQTVLSLKSLSTWDREHVRLFLVLNGYSNPSDSEINVIKERLEEGMSLETALELIRIFKAA